jgi:ribonuclease HI
VGLVELYTDGACSGNPGPGGWGCVLISGAHSRRLSGFERETTNNRMELTAVIRGLEALVRHSEVRVVTDSTYVKNAFTEGWLDSWQSRGWKTKDNKPVKNQDLWMELCRLRRMHALQWEWVKGHSGHPLNELCDSLAREAIVKRCGKDERSTLEGK